MKLSIQEPPPMADLATVMQAIPGAPKVFYQVLQQVHHLYILMVVILGEEHHMSESLLMVLSAFHQCQI
jgi:hypothetical protein